MIAKCRKLSTLKHNEKTRSCRTSFVGKGEEPLEKGRCKKEQGRMQVSARGTRPVSDWIGRTDEHLATPRLDRQERGRTRGYSRVPKDGLAVELEWTKDQGKDSLRNDNSAD